MKKELQMKYSSKYSFVLKVAAMIIGIAQPGIPDEK
jgi:hypothetical protein